MESVRNVRAKFWVSEITHHHQQAPGQVCATVKLQAAFHGENNKDWSRYTPTGSISMIITNPSAVDAFTLGQHFYVDFTPADD